MKPQKKMNPGARFVTIVPLVAMAALAFLFFQPPWTAPRVAGLAMMIVFSSLLTIARIQLGNAFTLTPQARYLVTGGIYSRVRHPVYVFSSGAIAGLLLYLDRPKLLLILLALIPLQVVRARQEERVLIEKFGESYLHYRKTTWF